MTAISFLMEFEYFLGKESCDERGSQSRLQGRETLVQAGSGLEHSCGFVSWNLLLFISAPILAD